MAFDPNLKQGVNGFLLLNKESGKRSFGLVSEMKRKMSQKKIGHSGTLDSLASGLMILALGNCTKLLNYLIGLDKEYEVLACFGSKSDTFDADGELVEISDKKILKEDVESAIKKHFEGDIFQFPPKYSALKISGKRASDIVRAGGVVEMKARKISVYSFDLIQYDFPLIRFRVSCSSGTYIRSLINDLGELLGVGAFVKELKRLKIGDYKLEEASDKLISISDFLSRMGKYELSEEEFDFLKDGKKVSSSKIPFDNDYIFAFYKNEFVGVLEKSNDGFLKMKLGGERG